MTLPLFDLLSDHQRRVIKLWLPAVLVGSFAWVLFVLVGETPLLRAAGLAMVIIGVSLSLRWLGSGLAIIGALALALTPAFWQQTGGGGGVLPGTIVLALSAAALIGTLAVSLSNRPYIALGVALAVFAVVFASQVGVTRSLRFTGIVSAWLIFLLTRAILLTNPRPDGPPPARLNAQYRAALLLILALGVINDPLLVLFVPAVSLGLAQSKTRIPPWYWVMMVAIAALGIFGIFNEYYHAAWWGVTAERAAKLAARHDLPYLVAAGWRDGHRWLDLFAFLAHQFTLIGLGLSVFGLARLARWYPTLGVTSLLAFAAFFVFGLAYYGQDRHILLLPLLIIQVSWITYAIHTFSEWLERSTAPANRQIVRWVAPVCYTVLPALLLWNLNQ